jgi:hypothetical protein
VVVEAAPVTWTNGRFKKSASEHVFQKVWFQDAQEMERRREEFWGYKATQEHVRSVKQSSYYCGPY